MGKCNSCIGGTTTGGLGGGSCEICGGSGWIDDDKSSSESSTCRLCHGAKKVKENAYSNAKYVTCWRCGGSGEE